MYLGHNLPSPLFNGQYDTEIHRVYLILHDVHDSKHIDLEAVKRKVHSKYPVAHTKVLQINSLNEEVITNNFILHL